MLKGGRVQDRGGERGEKKWYNCNSIINKISLKKVNLKSSHHKEKIVTVR